MVDYCFNGLNINKFRLIRNVRKKKCSIVVLLGVISSSLKLSSFIGIGD